jgi:diamine N-acetyltransferase
MIRVIQPDTMHLGLLSELGAQSFIESHGHSAPEADIKNYVRKMFSEERFKKELMERDAIFRLAFYNEQPAGYSKIVLNVPASETEQTPLCKMDRLYVLKQFYDKKIGKVLMDLNIQIAREKGQNGMWLNVWTENKRAVHFYEREGFTRSGETLFKISATHSNPNYRMYRNLMC